MNKSPITIEVLPMLEDNFGYLVFGPQSAVLVDAPEAGPVRKRLEERGAKLSHILITHEHHDHIGGLAELKKAYGAQVIAPSGSRVPSVDRFVSAGEKLEVAGIRVEVIWTPGHIAAHASFYLPDAAAVFTGDSMFGAGCGRLFGNPPEIMYASLQKLASLPDETRVYFGHEYTASNLRFALAVEPNNEAIRQRIAAAQSPSSPSTIGLEKATNPFVRARDVVEFAARRKQKDSF